jgi:hypothetical protein
VRIRLRGARLSRLEAASPCNYVYQIISRPSDEVESPDHAPEDRDTGILVLEICRVEKQFCW